MLKLFKDIFALVRNDYVRKVKSISIYKFHFNGDVKTISTIEKEELNIVRYALNGNLDDTKE